MKNSAQETADSGDFRKMEKENVQGRRISYTMISDKFL